VDGNAHVRQVDLSLPGHTCTIAESDRDATAMLSAFHLAGGRVQL
jgi:hypothetical protein